MTESTKGRPTSYTKEIGYRICSLIGMGKSLSSICGDDKEENDFPHRATVYRWFSDHKDFCDNYARAKNDSADADGDKIASITEDVLSGTVDPQAARVAIDALKWMAGKKKPKKYGDRVHTEHSGAIDMSSLSSDEQDRRIKELEQKFANSQED